MKTIGFVGKLLFAGPMAMFGIFHFMSGNAMTGVVPSYLPMPILWVYISGLGLILSAIAIITGNKAKLATQLLGAMLLAFAVIIHLPGFLMNDQMASTMFLKDIALGGSAWFMSANLSNG